MRSSSLPTCVARCRTPGSGTTSSSTVAAMPTDRPAGRLLDVPTVVAIAIVAYVLADVLHEAVGHGGACVLTGGKPLVLSTVHFDCGGDSRRGAAGGALVHLPAGAVGLRLLPPAPEPAAPPPLFPLV